MSETLTGKVIMATGAASGIGRAACLIFAREGAKVVVTDLNATGGAETVELIRRAGGTGEFIATDISNRTQVEAAVAFAVATYGRLDGAFNNAAAMGGYSGLLEADEETFDQIMSVNVRGLWHCMRAQIRQMQLQGEGGSIVNTASTAGLRGTGTMAVYSASKHAVVGLTKSVALEFAKTGPRVNAVCPGVVETPAMLRIATDESARGAFIKGQPNGRFGQPHEIGEAAAWLLSDAASFVTGIAMPVDGGRSI